MKTPLTHDAPTPPVPNRLPVLDHVRGVAIAAVLFHHLFVFQPAGPAGQVLARFAEFCGHGVDLFFVLSAFLLLRPLADNAPQTGWFTGFWRRRAAKIFPLYFLLLLFVYALLPAALAASGFGGKLALQQSVGDKWPWYAAFVSNWLNFVDGRFTNPALDVAWSLAIEVQFYLLLTFLVAINRHRSVALWLFLGLGAVLVRVVAWSGDWTWVAVLVATPARLDAFAAGALLALRPRWFAGPARLLGLSVFLVPLFLPWSRELPAVRLLGYSWVALGCASLIASALDTTASRASSRRSLLGFLGAISYAIYLTHIPVRAALRDIFLPAERNLVTPHDWMLQLAFYAAAGLACVLVGWCAWLLVERPAQRLVLAWSSSKRPAG